MDILEYFHKIKWQVLARLNPNYFIFSETEASGNQDKYRQSGQNDFDKIVLKDESLKPFLGNILEKICLEFGCGNGRMTEFFASQFERVYAVDISKTMIESAKKRLAQLKNISYLTSAGEKIDLPDNTVDFVFLMQCFNISLQKNWSKKLWLNFSEL